MGKAPSIVVVGGGVSGLSSAMHAAELGADDVVVIERDAPASGSSGLSVGNATTLYDDPFDVEMRVRSIEFLRTIEDEIGFRWTGNVRMSLDKGDLAGFERNAEMQVAYGIRARAVGPDDLAALVPGMRCDDVAGGIYSADAGHIDGHLLCGAYLRRAVDRGVRVLNQTALISSGRGRRRRHLLQTTRGEFECDVVINAAGAWAARVGEMLETPVEIVPQRHEVYLAELETPLASVLPQVGESYTRRNETSGSGLFFQYERPSTLLTGFHAGLVSTRPADDPDDYSTVASETHLEPLARALLHRLPGLSEMRLRPGWAGLYPMSPDERPQIGPWKHNPTVVAACGVGGFGLHISPMVGRIAAEWAILGEPRAIPKAEQLVPDRFEARAA